MSISRRIPAARRDTRRRKEKSIQPRLPGRPPFPLWRNITMPLPLPLRKRNHSDKTRRRNTRISYKCHEHKQRKIVLVCAGSYCDNFTFHGTCRHNHYGAYCHSHFSNSHSVGSFSIVTMYFIVNIPNIKIIHGDKNTNIYKNDVVMFRIFKILFLHSLISSKK